MPNTKLTLPELCSNFFSIILWIRTQSELGAPENLRQKILALFAKMETEGAKRGIPPADLHDAKFALTALLDETIMGSPWPGKSGWEKRMLQDEIFNTTNAGEEFFTRLDQLRRAERKATELLEVFHWCLLLGFEGRYDDRQALELLIRELKQELETTNATLGQALSPGWKPDRPATPVRRSSWRPALIISVACAAGSLLYFLILEYRLNAYAESTKASFESILAKPAAGQEGTQKAR